MVNDIHTLVYIYRVTLTAELMSNDTEFARVTEEKEGRRGNRFIHLIEFCVRQGK